MKLNLGDLRMVGRSPLDLSKAPRLLIRCCGKDYDLPSTFDEEASLLYTSVKNQQQMD